MYKISFSFHAYHPPRGCNFESWDKEFSEKKLQTLGSRSGSNELVGSRLIYFIELISVKLVAPPSRCCLNVLIDFLNIQSFTCPWDSLI